MKKKIMIVDDQSMARNLFEMYLENSEKYTVEYSLSTAAFADAFVLRNNIDLVLMDILMQDGSNGLDAAEKIKRYNPSIKIIAVTSMPEASWIKRARQIGIESFWYKESSKESILDVIDRTMNGESVYPDSAPVVQLGNINSDEFTERELDILRIMTTGASNAVIAGELNISEGTVKGYIHNMLEKTGYTSRTELAIEARISGIAVKI